MTKCYRVFFCKGDKDKMKIALTDMDIVWEDRDANKKQCKAMIQEAAVQGADMILFAEMTLTGFSMNVEKVADNNNSTIHFFAEQAIHYHIAIGFGYASKPDEKGRNHFAVVSEEGKVLMDYIKLHPFTYGGEANAYTGGDKLGCFEINDGWHCAGFICYDLRFPESFQKLPDRDIIFVIANWPQSRIHQWHTLLQARAIEMQCYVVGVNRTGEGDGIHYSKSSAVYDPKGNEVIAKQTKNDRNQYVEVNLRRRRKYAEHFPVRKDRRKGIDFH